MKIGLFTLGIGAGANPDVIRKAAETADRTGFATVWAPEHVVLFDQHDSKYPYSDSGKFPLAANADWLDPFIALSFAAAVTSKVRLATGICLVPEHNPLVLAKVIGWQAEEFAAIGVPFERRAQRTREYIEVMRKLWSDGVASHHGEFVNFDKAGSYPKPPQGAKLPVIFGGESNPALRRVAEYGDGWFGFNLDPAEAKERIAKLEQLLKQNGRKLSDVELIVSPYTKKITRDDLKRYRDLGVSEVPIMTNFDGAPAEAAARVEQTAKEWVEPAAKL
jgi:alkanesulfonate monooxygenase SsuD/methylene tetrahydromethanopterin reductase-like flavin-dependent oxidoreductase (luciferase family)